MSENEESKDGSPSTKHWFDEMVEVVPSQPAEEGWIDREGEDPHPESMY